MSAVNSIPASQVVAVRPNVLSAGGTSLDVIGLILTTNTRVPINTVKSFATLADVQSFFGPGHEADCAAVYFNGYNGSPVTPDAVLFAQYPKTAVSAYLRGGNISAITVAQLQAITGAVTAVIDGYLYPIASLDLSAASSFSVAATTLQTGFNGTKPTQASVTGSIATTVLTVSAIISGTLAPGQVVSGTGITVGTYIVAQLTGPVGGTGTYTVSVSQTAASTTVTAKGRDVVVTYDSQSGGFIITSANTGTLQSLAGFATGAAATSLLLTSATGAVTSQGADSAVPGPFMDSVLLLTQNWVTFMLAFNPDNSGNANRLLFAQWTNNQGDEFGFVCWDTDITPTAAVPATTSLGYLISQANYSGTFLIWEPSDLLHAPFICGAAGSIDFTRTAGRITFKFRQQDGLVAGVTNATIASNLAANGYNYYGGYATRNQNFNFLANGVVSGKFKWFDSYINQIWLNNQLQLAILTGMTQVGSIPYDSAGYGLIEAFCMDPINAALNFGAIQPGVTLSAAQVAEVNQAAGAQISSTLQTRGWYLQVKDAAPSVRAVRGSPPCTLWYMDGGSVQHIDLNSIEVQ